MKRQARHFSSMMLFAIGLLASGCGDDGGSTAAGGAGGSGANGGGGANGEGGAMLEGLLDADITGSPTGKTEMAITTLPGAYTEYRETPNGERISVHGNIPGTSGEFQVGEQSLRIYLQPYDGLRTYTLGAADGAGAAYAEQDATYTFYAAYGEPYETFGSGSITLTDRTEDRLVGEFSFTAEDDDQASSVSVSGTFDLPLLPDGG